MSERELYCERDIHYDALSSEIIRQFYINSTKTKYSSIKKYMDYKCLKKYDYLLSEYHKLHDLLLLVRKNLREHFQKPSSIYLTMAIKKQMYDIATQIASVYNTLAELEESEFIQSILNKKADDGISICRTFIQRGANSEDFLYIGEKFTSWEKNILKQNEQRKEAANHGTDNI